MYFTKIMLKSNKGFTLQDLALAIMILMLFVGTIGGTYLSIYKVQSDTKLESVATLFTVQIMEYIDKIAYEEITIEKVPEIIETVKNNFDISETFNININVTPSADEQDLIKKVKLTITYVFQEEEKSVVVERLKIKEL